jgi:sensor histidine kinase regulating citrate/malate metabolism
MYAHMMVLSHYLRKEEYNKAQEYLHKVMNISIFQNATFIDVGNDMINALISQRIHESNSQITISTSGFFPEKFWLEDMDLCVLFSNLISNSVEACEKLIYKEKEIVLVIEEGEKGVSFLIKNPTETEFKDGNFDWGTTKEDKQNHGYGLRNIKHIVEKYHGEMEIFCKDGLVLVKIGFPYIVVDKAL